MSAPLVGPSPFRDCCLVPRERLEVAWQTYLAEHAPHVARSTREGYATALRMALADLPVELSIGALTTWHRSALPARGYSPRYCNFVLGAVRTVVRLAALSTGDQDLQAMVWRVRPLKQPVRAPRCPPSDFLVRAMAACRNEGERCFVLLAGLAGLRKGELLGLRPADYDQRLRVLSVVRQRESSDRKNRRPHSVSVDSAVLHRSLVWAIANRQEFRAATGPRGRAGDAFIFPWSERYLEAFMKRLRFALGPSYLPAKTAWHAFRHWGASELARLGMSAWDLQAWLGDASVDVAVSYVASVRGMTRGTVGALARVAGLKSAKRVEKIARKQRANAAPEQQPSRGVEAPGPNTGKPECQARSETVQTKTKKVTPAGQETTFQRTRARRR